MGPVVQSQALLSYLKVLFVVCDYINSVFYGNLRPRYALIHFATPVETMAAPMKISDYTRKAVVVQARALVLLTWPWFFRWFYASGSLSC